MSSSSSIPSTRGRPKSTCSRVTPPKLAQVLGWKPEVDFRGLIKMMIEHDLELARREKYAKSYRLVGNRNAGMAVKGQGRSRPRCTRSRLDGRSWSLARTRVRRPIRRWSGLNRAGLLRRFVTSCYYDPDGRLPVSCAAARSRPIRPAGARLAPPARPRDSVGRVRSDRSQLRPGIAAGGPTGRETRPGSNAALAQWRTERFDGRLARLIAQNRPEAVLVFSDVGSALDLADSVAGSASRRS